MTFVDFSCKDLTFDYSMGKKSFTIKNLSMDQRLCFKIKATSNKKFIVTPFTAVVNKAESLKITVIMKFEDLTPEDLKSKETFAIYYSQVDDGLESNKDILDFI